MRLWPSAAAEPIDRLRWILRDRPYPMRWRTLLSGRHWMVVLVREGESRKSYARKAGQ